jgi:DNA-directed RNA polymerase subunit RPC12/RpoP
MSHTKRDQLFCNKFDSAAARVKSTVPFNVYRSEFEMIEKPDWYSISSEIKESLALFLLVGNELINAQNSTDSNIKESWKHTQNWISFEIGVACSINLDVWVICETNEINFPVPYLNNYHILSLESKPDIEWLKDKLQNYLDGKKYPCGFIKDLEFTCEHCASKYNLHTIAKKTDSIKCPTCLKNNILKYDWPRFNY